MYNENINVKNFIKMSASEVECFHSLHYFYAIQIHNTTSHDEKNIEHYMHC